MKSTVEWTRRCSSRGGTTKGWPRAREVKRVDWWRTGGCRSVMISLIEVVYWDESRLVEDQNPDRKLAIYAHGRMADKAQVFVDDLGTQMCLSVGACCR